MTPTEKHRETAHEVFRDYLKRIEYDRRPCFEHDELIQQLFATALANSEREGMKRAAEIAKAHYDARHATLARAHGMNIASAILSEAEGA